MYACFSNRRRARWQVVKKIRYDERIKATQNDSLQPKGMAAPQHTQIISLPTLCFTWLDQRSHYQYYTLCILVTRRWTQYVIGKENLYFISLCAFCAYTMEQATLSENHTNETMRKRENENLRLQFKLKFKKCACECPCSGFYDIFIFVSSETQTTFFIKSPFTARNSHKVKKKVWCWCDTFPMWKDNILSLPWILSIFSF